jgi:hypothetical protein
MPSVLLPAIPTECASLRGPAFAHHAVFDRFVFQCKCGSFFAVAYYLFLHFSDNIVGNISLIETVAFAKDRWYNVITM